MRRLRVFIKNEHEKNRLIRQLNRLGYELDIPLDKERLEDFINKDGICIVDKHYADKYASYGYGFLLYVDVLNDHTVEWLARYACLGLVHKHYSELILKAVIETALNQIKVVRLLHKENQRLSKKLQDRRIVEKAKYLLMKRLLISEQEAYESMRTLAMEKQWSMRAVADNILINEE